MIKNYEMVGLALFTAAALVPIVPALGLALRYFREKEVAARRRRRSRLLIASGIAVAIYGLVVVDAYWLEPNWVAITRIEIEGDVGTPLRILHLSDLHIEKEMQARERWLLEQIPALQPDLIILTGDTHQMDNYDVPSLRNVLSKLEAPLGVYACMGYDQVGVLEAAAPHITFLENESVLIERGDEKIGVAGLVNVGGRAKVYAAISEAEYRIAMNHTPDLAEEAAGIGMDLYLCGHTHGGQVRVPVWGAIITNTSTGKRFEAGHYEIGDTDVYTSRGLGLEPPPAPQVRFLCRPEITLITVRPR